MDNNYQLTIDDLEYQKVLEQQPKRFSFIDECGNFGFDFSKEGTSNYYILCAVVVDADDIDELHTCFDEIKKKNGFRGDELKSSKVSDNRRFRIMTQLLPLNFKIVLLIADKRKFYEESPIREYKPTFIKHLNQHLYNLLYRAYPKLDILQDEMGYTEFQQSFAKYIDSIRPGKNLFDEYSFAFVDSKDEVLVQMADFIGGSIAKFLNGEASANYLEILRGKLVAQERFPHLNEPYWGLLSPEDRVFDQSIISLSLQKARDYIEDNKQSTNDDIKMQVSFLEYLVFYVTQIDSTKYVYADELVKHIQGCVDIRVTKDKLFRRVVAPLRDKGLVIASCPRGYKIPISVNEILTYLNQSNSIVGPMISRMRICRDIIKQNTDNELDLFDKPAYIKYKRYFDEI